jgi:hypothetical protein
LADVIFVALNGVGVLTILGWADERLSCIGGKVKTGKKRNDELIQQTIKKKDNFLKN